MAEYSVKNILCIGAGYVGGPTMAVMARHCPDVEVVVADINPERIAAWQSGAPPIYEPGLDAVVRKGLGRNLHFTTDVAAAIARADASPSSASPSRPTPMTSAIRRLSRSAGICWPSTRMSA